MLKSVDQVLSLIEAGKSLLLAGDKKLLDTLPAGNWIAGTIPYFMDEQGGITTREKIFVQEIGADVKLIKSYKTQELKSILNDAPENGFTVLIIPSGSKAHIEYATNAPEYPNMYTRPIIGWISGIHLDDIGKSQAGVYNGEATTFSTEDGVAIHFELPQNKMAHIGILNLFKQGNGATITFPQTGFTVTDCEIDGKPMNLATYIQENGIDTKLPLVADYNGAMINVSIQEVKGTSNEVALYAPVFPNTQYRFASPIEDYIDQFKSAIPTQIDPVFTCNCILNFLYSDLEGKKANGTEGPITFGEIAYQLLNQTMVYLEIVNN